LYIYVILFKLTVPINQKTQNPNNTASFDSLSWYGIPIRAYSKRSPFQPSNRFAAELISNRTTWGKPSINQFPVTT